MSKGSESIKELRKICQESRYEGGKAEMPRITRFHRTISIFLTKPLLKVGVSANQATLIGLFIGVISGLFLTFENPIYWILGALFLYLYLIFDYVDGEIARYNKSVSKFGEYLAGVVDLFGTSFIPICMSFGISKVFHNTLPMLFGFLAVLSLSLSAFTNLASVILLRSEKSSEAPHLNDTKKSQKILFSVKKSIRYGKLIFNFHKFFIPVLLIVSIIDLWFGVNITIGHFPVIGFFIVNARYLWLIAFSMAILISLILKIYYTARKGFWVAGKGW